ncbi:FG-GAP-like repeat-containing protein [Streptomyces sp. NPDC059009]|uniref:FG-GAP-like repeat-containing protein n=1 Tax=Streptomyces sp. NPDC059009 TaxID=3346694 RepID=UPI003693517B
MRRSVIAAVAAAALATPLALAAGAGSASAAAPVPPRKPVVDFNHDGYPDIVVSAPEGTPAGQPERAGYVSVVYGSASGPDTAHTQVISRGTEGVPGDGSAYFSAGGAADLDGDSYTDLVVGEYNNGAPDVVLWGSKEGLSGRNSSELPPLTGGATGDFNGDGHYDLVTSEYPENDDPNDTESGMTVSYGPFQRDGKPARQDSILVDNNPYGPGSPVVGDMTGDGADDVVLTSRGHEEMANGSLFYKGGANGLSHTDKSIKSTSGGTIADFNGDGYGDFAAQDTGTYTEDDWQDKGTVRIEYGSANGPSRVQKITQDSPGVPGIGEAGTGDYPDPRYQGDRFGADVSGADVNGDGYADLAVGIPGEDLKAGSRTVWNAGSVVLLKGARNGLSGTGAQAFTQTTANVPGASETNDMFGTTVLLRDLNGDKKADLGVGAPDEDGTYEDSGAVWTLRGTAGGLTTTGIGSFGPKTLGAPEKNARFGQSLGQ